MVDRPMRQTLFLVAVAAVFAVSAGCGPEQGFGRQDFAGGRSAAKGDAGDKYTPPEELLPAPEPADAPPLEEEPAGEVVELGSSPEGMVADAGTGLVAVGLRNPDELALIDVDSGEVVRKTDLSGSPRHLGLVTGGPVLVPAESSDTLIQVGLPGGGVVEETPVDNFPHAAAAAAGGRIFAANEGASTVSVIEDGKTIRTLETPLNPGGVAVTRGGLVGIVGVRGLALEVLEADTLESLGRIDAGRGPTHVEAGPDGRFYVADTRGDALLVYEARPELRRVARVPLPGGSPYGLAVDPGREKLWVTLTARNRLVEFDLADDAPREAARYPTVRQPNSVTVNPADGRVFVAGRTGEVLQVLDPRRGRS